MPLFVYSEDANKKKCVMCMCGRSIEERKEWQRMGTAYKKNRNLSYERLMKSNQVACLFMYVHRCNMKPYSST